MAKLGIFASILTISAALGYASLQSTSVDAAGECKRTTFQTAMVKDACAKGGQKAAKDAMKAFLKEAKTKNPKITGCPTCHSKVGGDFPLKKDGLEIFKAAGGEVIDAPATKAPPPTKTPAVPPATKTPSTPPTKTPAVPPATK